ncbi:MAG: aldehyde dehydrogenase family protein [Vicinamibacterales bacterium]
MNAKLNDPELSLGKVPRKMLIDGQWVNAAAGRAIDVFDPATGKLIARVPEGDKEDIDSAVKAARRTFDQRTWLNLTPAERAKILWRVGDLIDRRAADIASVETLDNGVPQALAQMTISGGAEAFRYYAGWITKIHGTTSTVSVPGAQFHSYTLREPVGVVGLIVPWNAPFALACSKLSVALAAGCSCVLKPAEETPLNALVLGEILQEAGIPAGVVNIVTGFGHTAGAALAAHPGVDKIGFTGSTEVGKLIVNAASGNLKKVTLELGGKSPMVAFDDADLEKTVAGAAMAIFTNSGQVCIAGSRLYVQRKLYEPVVEGLAGVAKGMKVGSGFDPNAQMGPLISEKQLTRVTSLIKSGLDEGAQVAAGGQRSEGSGYFVQPTVITGAKPTARVMREEIFGPVICVQPFDDIDAVAAAANDTPFGLAASVWTRDVSKAHTMAKRLQAGNVWVNCHLVGDMSMPFGGYKQSGWGRESGLEGLDAYLQTKSVFVQL